MEGSIPQQMKAAVLDKGVNVQGYDGEPGTGAFERLDALEDAAQAHRDLEKHFLGKLALRMR